MSVTVLMSSGESDAWEDVHDTEVTDGYLFVMSDPETVAAMYAPGMWMKVEYERSA